jgi:hypothetical protein
MGCWWQPLVACVIGPTCQRLNIATGVVMSSARCYTFLARIDEDIFLVTHCLFIIRTCTYPLAPLLNSSHGLVWRIKPLPPRWTSLTNPIGNGHYVRWSGGLQCEVHASCWRGGLTIIAQNCCGPARGRGGTSPAGPLCRRPTGGRSPTGGRVVPSPPYRGPAEGRGGPSSPPCRGTTGRKGVPCPYTDHGKFFILLAFFS